MEKLERKAVTGLMLSLLLASMLSMAFVTPMKAQYSVGPHTAALWHFDEVDASGVTPDATGNNPGALGPVIGNISCAPMLVEGKFGKALSFDGYDDYVYVYPTSPSLDIADEITIEAWINLKAFTVGSPSCHIVVKCARNGIEYPWMDGVSRIYGLAVKAGLPETAGLVPQGALGGFVFTDAEGFNEIVTTEPVISLNQWTHVAFTCCKATGMRIYVNGAEKDVKAIYGVQNPTGSIKNGNEFYIGHELDCIIDEVRISNVALEPQIPPLWMQWWFWTVIATGIVVLAGTVYFLKKRKPPTAPQILQNER